MRTESSNPVDLLLHAYEIDTTRLAPTHRTDLRTYPPDVCVELPRTDWSNLDWSHAGTPHKVTAYSEQRLAWEKKHGRRMPELLQWKHYNRNLHELFYTPVLTKRMQVRKNLINNLRDFRLGEADKSVQEAINLRIWNYLHRKEDAFWDPRGKRAFFEGLPLKKPRILALAAGDGYDAMVLLSLYGGSARLVDFDDFCATDRFGRFPHDYPFLTRTPETGGWKTCTRGELDIEFEVANIESLSYGKEFDVVISSGLVEHYPDKYKPLIFHLHRQFLKPGGYAILTASRNYARLRAFYHLMSDRLNYSHRELMSAPQLGLYTYENGFKIMSCGYIKAHNIVIARER